MVFIDPATQYNKIYAHLFDLSVEYKPLNIPSRAAIVIDDVQVHKKDLKVSFSLLDDN